MYSVFVNKLNQISYEDCGKAIKIVCSDKCNREVYNQIDKYPFCEEGELKPDGNGTELENLIDGII